MAAVNGTVHSVQTLKSDAVDGLQIAEVLFTIPSTETYAQADDGILSGVPTLIQNSRRNGKTVTMVGVMASQRASKQSDPSQYLGLITVAISSTNVTFAVTDNHAATEHASAAMTAQSRPFGIAVSFTEA